MCCGYSQKGDQDFDQIFNGVVNDVTFWMMLVVTMVLKLSSLVFDVELAFLNAKMDFDNYMGTPKGVEAAPDECVLLQKALYGSLQASRLWGLHYAKIMKKIGFHQSKSDPCLFVRQNEKG